MGLSFRLSRLVFCSTPVKTGAATEPLCDLTEHAGYGCTPQQRHAAHLEGRAAHVQGPNRSHQRHWRSTLAASRCVTCRRAASPAAATPHRIRHGHRGARAPCASCCRHGVGDREARGPIQVPT
jgi:hypothetical protein